MALTKSELIQTTMEHSELTRHNATKFIEDFFDIISTSLEKGVDVKIPSFGNFMLRDKNSRVGRNPKTGEEFPISARRVVSFKPSNILKMAIRDLQNK